MDRDLADCDVWHDCFLSPLQIGGGLRTVMPPPQLKRKEGHLLIQPLPHPFKIKIRKIQRFTHITCLHKPKTSWVFFVVFFLSIFLPMFLHTQQNHRPRNSVRSVLFNTLAVPFEVHRAVHIHSSYLTCGLTVFRYSIYMEQLIHV